ncbi:hypothetical protein J6590_069040 [Homalodisca vitripennis]|nr:hypothetical protein J6590_069040 [Homalodisca vitripennis]
MKSTYITIKSKSPRPSAVSTCTTAPGKEEVDKVEQKRSPSMTLDHNSSKSDNTTYHPPAKKHEMSTSFRDISLSDAAKRATNTDMASIDKTRRCNEPSTVKSTPEINWRIGSTRITNRWKSPRPSAVSTCTAAPGKEEVDKVEQKRSERTEVSLSDAGKHATHTYITSSDKKVDWVYDWRIGPSAVSTCTAAPGKEEVDKVEQKRSERTEVSLSDAGKHATHTYITSSDKKVDWVHHWRIGWTPITNRWKRPTPRAVTTCTAAPGKEKVDKVEQKRSERTEVSLSDAGKHATHTYITSSDKTRRCNEPSTVKSTPEINWRIGSTRITNRWKSPRPSAVSTCTAAPGKEEVDKVEQKRSPSMTEVSLSDAGKHATHTNITSSDKPYTLLTPFPLAQCIHIHPKQRHNHNEINMKQPVKFFLHNSKSETVKLLKDE